MVTPVNACCQGLQPVGHTELAHAYVHSSCCSFSYQPGFHAEASMLTQPGWLALLPQQALASQPIALAA